MNLAKEQPIPPAPIVKNINHTLSEKVKAEVSQKISAYHDRMVIGMGTALVNLIGRASHNDDATDMKTVTLYDCNVSRMVGDYQESFFHRAFAISKTEIKAMQSDKNRIILMNYNDVNEYKVYEDNDLYKHKDGGFGIAVVAKDLDLSNVVAINYKCQIVPNTIF
jgi:hypothetical protein